MVSLFIIFLFGLFVGSFLNCVIYRLEVEKSFLSGRSFCPHCKHTLAVKDLIPLLSFLILKGKCRYCQKPISWQYPFVEISTGLIFLLIFNFQFSIFNKIPIFNFQSLLFTIYYLLTACFLIIIFVFDLKHYLIPDKIIYPVIGTVFLFRIFNFQFSIFNEFSTFNFQTANFYYPILSAFGAATFFLTIVLVSRGKWMGVGDVKLAFFMGLFLGFPKILSALFFAFFIGAAVGITLIIFEKKTLKSEIPFGPFLISGTFFALFFGPQIISWYQNLVFS